MSRNERFLWEEGCKFQARVLLSDNSRSLLSLIEAEEWIGINLLKRDDEL